MARLNRFFAAIAIVSTAASAQQVTQPQGEHGGRPFEAGRQLGVTLDGAHTPISSNVKVYGAVVNAESCSYDETRGLIAVINRGAHQDEAPNDGFVSLLNSDGSVHTAKWIGETRDGLVLNHPFGSEIHDGKLYLADSDGGTRAATPTTAVLRLFDMKSGAPAGEIPVLGSPRLNDIAISADGSVYATQTGTADGEIAMRLYKISPSGEATILIEGEPLVQPNGVAIDNDGNVVVVNMGNDEILTLSSTGRLLKTEKAAQAGSDGLVIMPDGTKYVSSVQQGGISRIRPGQSAELIATGIPNAASMCFDSRTKQLVVPMNQNNGIALVPID